MDKLNTIELFEELMKLKQQKIRICNQIEELENNKDIFDKTFNYIQDELIKRAREYTRQNGIMNEYSEGFYTGLMWTIRKLIKLNLLCHPRVYRKYDNKYCPICNQDNTNHITINDTAKYSNVEIALNKLGELRVRTYLNGLDDNWDTQDVINIKYCPFCGQYFPRGKLVRKVTNETKVF